MNTRLRLSTDEFAAGADRLRRTLSSARSSGYPGWFELAGTRVRVENAGDPLPFPSMPTGALMLMMDADLQGAPGEYAGWRITAELYGDDVHPVLGVTQGEVNAALQRAPECAYCGVDAGDARRLLLTSASDSAQTCTGCVQAFTGSRVPPRWFTPQVLSRQIPRSPWKTPAFAPEYVLAVALASVELDGFVTVNTSTGGAVPTAQVVSTFLSGVGPAAESVRSELGPEVHRLLPRVVDEVFPVLRSRVENRPGYQASLLRALDSPADARQAGVLSAAANTFVQLCRDASHR